MSHLIQHVANPLRPTKSRISFRWLYTRMVALPFLHWCQHAAPNQVRDEASDVWRQVLERDLPVAGAETLAPVVINLDVRLARPGGSVTVNQQKKSVTRLADAFAEALLTDVATAEASVATSPSRFQNQLELWRHQGGSSWLWQRLPRARVTRQRP